jgi:predicted transcriptional regulator YdeE
LSLSTHENDVTAPHRYCVDIITLYRIKMRTMGTAANKGLEVQQLITMTDVNTLCVPAKNYPEGITEAFQTLERLHPTICERPFYGISFKEADSQQIIYKAAVAEAYEGEALDYGCEQFKIPAATYLSVTIKDFMNDLEAIPRAFERLLKSPGIDPEFPCIEWYKSDRELVCLIKLNTFNP